MDIISHQKAELLLVYSHDTPTFTVPSFRYCLSEPRRWINSWPCWMPSSFCLLGQMGMNGKITSATGRCFGRSSLKMLWLET